jgi:hypothetical protein
MDDHAILMELGKIGLKGVARLARMVDTRRANLLKNLDEIIPPHKHKKFQSTFFDEKETYYNKFINLINILPTWQRAIDLLHLFFARKGIDPLSQEASEFKSLVYLRYFPGSSLRNHDKVYRA